MNDTQHNRLSALMTLSIKAFCHYAARCYAQCRVLLIAMPNMIILILTCTSKARSLLG
jgi:hypothetical protein